MMKLIGITQTLKKKVTQCSTGMCGVTQDVYIFLPLEYVKTVNGLYIIYTILQAKL